MLRVSNIVTILAAFLSLSIVASPAVFAQSRPVSLTDQRQTALSIRRIDSFAEQGVRTITRIQSNTDLLLTSLDARGVTEQRLVDVATHYQNSITAARFRRAAQINTEASRQDLRLRALAGSESLREDLEAARDSAVSELIQLETDTRAAIQTSLTTLLTN